MVWPMIAAAAASAAASAYGAKSAADAQSDAASKNRKLQQQMMQQQLTMYEPTRALGYGALSDIANLYGYTLPEYTPLNQLLSTGAPGSGYGTQMIRVGGGGGGGNVGGGRGTSGFTFNPIGKARTAQNFLDPAGAFGLGGSAKDRAWGGYIDPITGTVNIPGHEKFNQEFTNYLRTGEGRPDGGQGRYHDLKKAIDNLRGSGWTYDPNAAASQNPAPQTAQAGNMSRFFTSPDYQFRLQQGTKDIGNSFAARGGAASGNALRRLNEFNSGLAAGEYGNYVNRLLSMAGLGQTATGGASNAITNATQGISQANQAAGDARASGIMGGVNGLTGAINNGMNTWMWDRYLNGSSYGGMVNPISSGQAANAFSQIPKFDPQIPYYRG